MQFTYSLLSRGIFSLFSVAYLWLFGANMPVHDFAYFAVFDSYKLFAGNVPSWGSAQAFIRQANRGNGDPLPFWGSMAIQTICFFISIAVLLISIIVIAVCWQLPFNPASLFLSASLFLAGYYGYQLIKSLFLSRHDTKAVFFIELFLMISLAAFIFLVLNSRIVIDLMQSIQILASCYLITDIFCILIFKPFSNLGDKPSSSELFKELQLQFRYIKHSVPNNLAANFVNIIDTSIVLFSLGPVTTAAYKAAKIFSSCYVVIAEAFNYTLFPEFSRYDKNSRTTAKYKLNASYKAAFLLSLPISLSVMFFGQHVLSFLYKGKYNNTLGMAALLLCMGIWGTTFLLNRLASTYIGALGFPNILLGITIITAITGSLLLAVLSISFGLAGCGLSLVVSAIINYIFLKRYVERVTVNDDLVAVN